MIHLVVPDGPDDWVIRRQARYLADGLSWSMGERPSAKADVNVFIPYLLWPRFRWDKTLTAAWFTHRDDGKPGKLRLWQEAAQGVTLRVSQTPLYADDLAQYGRTLAIPAGVDTEHFRIVEHVRHDPPWLGVAGFCYGDGRKGESLVARLATEAHWQLRVAGKGWPVRARLYTWEALPSFYQQLDALVVTATMEGGPLPPFEALACGVPVVIPGGVGGMDMLPEMAGIRHYPAGDYEALTEAVERALGDNADPWRLRQVALGYSVSEWCRKWQGAITDLLQPAPTYVPDKPKDPLRCGVYMVAFGEPARACARKAIASIKAHMPDLPVALASDRELGPEDVLIAAKDEDIGGRSVKTKMWDYAPEEWDAVLYLDADTEMVAPVPFLFQVLQDGWDMAICINPDRYHIARHMVRPDNRDECEYTWKQIGSDELIQYQGGVISFRRNERTKALLTAWHQEWQRWGKRDQAALLRAMHQHPVKLYLLGNEWNLSTRYHDPARSAGILHNQVTARRWEGIIPGRLDSPGAWEAVRRWERRR